MEKRYTFNQEKILKVVRNAAIFLAPAALVFLIVIQMGGSLDEALIALKLWGLNTAIDVIRKFIAGK